MSSVTTPRPHTKWPLAVLFGIVGAVIVGVVMLAFLWPSVTSESRNLPVSISGPAAAVEVFENVIDDASPGLIDFVVADDRSDAVSQVETRQTYGAIIIGSNTEVLTAPAAGAAATQILTGIATQLQAPLVGQTAAASQANTPLVTVTPLVPLSESDPNGSGLTAASFPLVIGGLVGGILVTFLVVGVVRRLVALAAFGISAGLVITAVMQSWLGILQGNFGTNVVATGLAVLATSAFIVGCTSLLGTRGISIGAVLTMFIGNPLSAAASPWQFLAEPFGAIGQFLVPGAANSLIRALSYFPEANMTQQWLVLIGWTVLGLALAIGGHFRSRAVVHLPETTLEPATAAA